MSSYGGPVLDSIATNLYSHYVAGQSSKVRLLDGMDQINVFLRKILESGVDGGVAAVRKAIDLYNSCVNTPLIDELGAQPLLDLINSTGSAISATTP